MRSQLNTNLRGAIQPRTEQTRCLVMGILNTTPDSFSDGGRYGDADRAVQHGLAMVAAGCDLVDVGGESTRPGANRIEADAELRRVMPVVSELARAGVAVSIDTTRARVAEAAIAAGAVLVNDVSGGLADPSMACVVADAGLPWVLMHWRGHSLNMSAGAHYYDVVAEVRQELLVRVDAALAAGVAPEQIILDPGLGFAKNQSHDVALLAELRHIIDLGFPVLLGASRKRFLGAVLGDLGRPRSRAIERDAATIATSVLAARAGAWAVRVHDVAANMDAVRIVAAVESASRPAGNADGAVGLAR